MSTKYFIPLFIITLLVGMSCTHETVTTRDELFTPPSYKYKPRLLYPKVAQEQAFTGSLKFVVRISRTGVVENVTAVTLSGNEALDSAAYQYCRDVVFYPAQRGGVAIPSRIEIPFTFGMSSPSWDGNSYVREVMFLIAQVNRLDPAGKNQVRREILKKHKEFVQNMADALNFNSYVEHVVLPATADEWKKDWDSWPLSFLLFHDFIQRFPEYDSLASVKQQLVAALGDDVRYIERTRASSARDREQKAAILEKIRTFLGVHYPAINLDDLGTGREYSTRYTL